MSCLTSDCGHLLVEPRAQPLVRAFELEVQARDRAREERPLPGILRSFPRIVRAAVVHYIQFACITFLHARSQARYGAIVPQDLTIITITRENIPL